MSKNYYKIFGEWDSFQAEELSPDMINIINIFRNGLPIAADLLETLRSFIAFNPHFQMKLIYFHINQNRDFFYKGPGFESMLNIMESVFSNTTGDTYILFKYCVILDYIKQPESYKLKALNKCITKLLVSENYRHQEYISKYININLAEMIVDAIGANGALHLVSSYDNNPVAAMKNLDALFSRLYNSIGYKIVDYAFEHDALRFIRWVKTLADITTRTACIFIFTDYKSNQLIFYMLINIFKVESDHNLLKKILICLYNSNSFAPLYSSIMRLLSKNFDGDELKQAVIKHPYLFLNHNNFFNRVSISSDDFKHILNNNEIKRYILDNNINSHYISFSELFNLVIITFKDSDDFVKTTRFVIDYSKNINNSGSIFYAFISSIIPYYGNSNLKADKKTNEHCISLINTLLLHLDDFGFDKYNSYTYFDKIKNIVSFFNIVVCFYSSNKMSISDVILEYLIEERSFVFSDESSLTLEDKEFLDHSILTICELSSIFASKEDIIKRIDIVYNIKEVSENNMCSKYKQNVLEKLTERGNLPTAYKYASNIYDIAKYVKGDIAESFPSTI